MASWTLKWPTTCYHCGARLKAGSRARWHHAFGHSCLNTWECEARRDALVGLDKLNDINENGNSEREKK